MTYMQSTRVLLAQALLDTRRLLAHHGEVVQQQLTALVAAVSPACQALRSQTARAALLTLQACVYCILYIAHAHAACSLACLQRNCECTDVGHSRTVYITPGRSAHAEVWQSQLEWQLPHRSWSRGRGPELMHALMQS